MKQMKTSLIIVILLSTLLYMQSCTYLESHQYEPRDDAYILDNGEGLVLMGEKYIPIDLGVVETSYNASASAKSWGRIYNRNISKLQRYWGGRGVFRSTPVEYQMEIPLVYAGYDLDGYYCLESKYDECVAYIQNLTWVDQFVVRGYSSPDIVLPAELAMYILQSGSKPQPGETKPHERKAKYFSVYQVDETGNFLKRAGQFWIRSTGEVYFFYTESDTLALDQPGTYSPTEEQYRQNSEKLAPYLLPEHLWDDVVSFKNAIS